MAPPPNPKQNRNRRKKKRRTEDFSSDSDSDSSDSSSTETEPAPVVEAPVEKAINIDDVDIDSDSEKPHNTEEPLSLEAQKQVKSIKFTTTENQALAEAQETIRKDRQQLESEFLGLMATGFAGDLDELRKKPDFTEKSIVMLAKTLQSGSNMFDDETLDALLKK